MTRNLYGFTYIIPNLLPLTSGCISAKYMIIALNNENGFIYIIPKSLSPPSGYMSEWYLTNIEQLWPCGGGFSRYTNMSISQRLLTFTGSAGEPVMGVFSLDHPLSTQTNVTYIKYHVCQPSTAKRVWTTCSPPHETATETVLAWDHQTSRKIGF